VAEFAKIPTRSEAVRILANSATSVLSFVSFDSSSGDQFADFGDGPTKTGIGVQPRFGRVQAVQHGCMVAAAEIAADRFQALAGELPSEVDCHAAGLHDGAPT